MAQALQSLVEKRCGGCHTTQPIVDFTRHQRSPDGRGSYCRACRKSKLREWREANREKVRANKRASYRRHKDAHAVRMRAYREKNAEALRAKVKAKYHANRERRIAEVREWRLENPGKARLAWDRWQRNNPGAVRESNRQRKLWEKRATPKWASRSDMRAIYEEAARMRLAGVHVHVDHIVPIRGRTVCGLHCEANLRILPASENQRKSYWYWPDMP